MKETITLVHHEKKWGELVPVSLDTMMTKDLYSIEEYEGYTKLVFKRRDKSNYITSNKRTGEILTMLGIDSGIPILKEKR